MTPGERFELLEPIGEGGFGRTFLARDSSSGEQVVLKQLRVRGLPDWKPVEHFEREVKVLRSLSHPGIPAFVDAYERSAGADDSDVEMTIVVEFVPGDTLAARIERGDRWSEAQAVALLRDLLETLCYLHELAPPVIHRDITPANVVVRPDGRAILVDFGAVRDLATPRAGQMTVLGTPGYMAPEQSLGVSDPRSDLYSLGATMLHTLTHVAPVALPRQDLRFDFDRIEGLPPSLVAVLSRMTDPDPGRRWPSARSVLAGIADPGPADDADDAGPDSTALVAAAPPSSLVLVEDDRELTPAVLRRLDYRNALAVAAMQPSEAGAAKRVALGSGAAAAGLIGGIALIGPAAMAAFPLLLFGGMGWFFLAAKRRRDHARRLFSTGQQLEGKLVSSRQGQQGVFLDYVYKVDGQRYEGLGYTSDVTVTNTIRAGMPVLVFYDPDKPKRSVGLLRSELDGIRAANRI